LAQEFPVERKEHAADRALCLEGPLPPGHT